MNLRRTTRRTVLVYGRCNKLKKKQHYIYLPPIERFHVLFDFFLPRPSLSTTCSSHATCGPLRGAPRRRRVPAGVRPTARSGSDAAADASRCSAFCTTSAVREPSRDTEFDGPPP